MEADYSSEEVADTTVEVRSEPLADTNADATAEKLNDVSENCTEVPAVGLKFNMDVTAWSQGGESTAGSTCNLEMPSDDSGILGRLRKHFQTTVPIPIFSYAVFLLLFTIAVAVLIAHHSDNGSSNLNVTMVHSKAVITVYMTYSIIFIIFCFRWRKHSDFVSFERHTHQHSNEYLLVSVYVFGGGNFTKGVQEIFSYAHCTETVMDIIFTVVYLIFILLQVMFLQGFSEAHFKWRIWVHASLYIMVVSNATIWLFYLLEETNLFDDRERDLKLHAICIANDRVVAALSHWKEYLLPFTLEYCIIVTGLIYNIATRMVEGEPAVGHELHPRDVGKHLPPVVVRSNTMSSLIVIDSSDNDTLHSEPFAEEGGEYHKRRKPKRTEVLMRMRYRVKGSQPGLTLGIAMAVILITAQVCVQKKESTYDLMFFYGFVTVVNVTVMVGFQTLLRISRSYELQWYPFRIDDSLLMLTSFGMIIWSLLSMLAAIGSRVMSVATRVLAVFCCLSLAVATIVQTAMIIYMQRVYPKLKEEVLGDYDEEPINNAHAEGFEMMHIGHSASVASESSAHFKNIIRQRSRRMSKPALKKVRMDRAPESSFNQASMFTMTVNLGFWVLNSFFEIKNYGQFVYPMGVDFYGLRVWTFVASITYPLCIFFRFHSLGMIYEMWAKFNGFVRVD